ncbi:hypothetical protein BDR04DRAFT_1141011 [Suillus decipiens]|nr:hypothetical protein BDR04DRAFT_1141011 [Suillus decipiens]
MAIERSVTRGNYSKKMVVDSEGNSSVLRKEILRSAVRRARYLVPTDASFHDHATVDVDIRAPEREVPKWPCTLYHAYYIVARHYDSGWDAQNWRRSGHLRLPQDPWKSVTIQGQPEHIQSAIDSVAEKKGGEKIRQGYKKEEPGKIVEFILEAQVSH